MTESILCLKYYRNIVIVMTKGKTKKMKTTEIYFFLLAPTPQLFLRQKVLKIFFIDTWVSGQRVGKLTVWYEGKSKREGGCNNSPLLRERVNMYVKSALKFVVNIIFVTTVRVNINFCCYYYHLSLLLLLFTLLSLKFGRV